MWNEVKIGFGEESDDPTLVSDFTHHHFLYGLTSFGGNFVLDLCILVWRSDDAGESMVFGCGSQHAGSTYANSIH
jgi:hypothetical protein